MISSLTLLAVLFDLVIVLLLAAAVAWRGATQLWRALVATFAFAGAWILTATFDALRAPGWTLIAGASVIVSSIVVIVVTVHRWTQGDEGEPSWWPEFERRFARYVAEQEREASR